MNGLQFGVGEVSGHLAAALLIIDRFLRKFFAARLHAQTDDVLATDVDQLLRFADFFSIVDYKQWNAEKKAAESLDCLAELAGSC